MDWKKTDPEFSEFGIVCSHRNERDDEKNLYCRWEGEEEKQMDH